MNTVQTKIIATIGPACNSREMLEKIIKAGANVCRLNFSHSDYVLNERVINDIREIKKETGLNNVTILADLQGPKLRVGEMENNGVELQTGAEFRLVSEPCVGNSEKAYMNYTPLPKEVHPGEKILVDDGKIKLEVVSTNGTDTIITKVLNGGILSSRKGVNLPDTKINLPCLTPKDLADVDFIISQKLEWIGLSFVRHENDILELKNLLRSKGSEARIVAKIEKPEAIEHLDQIIHATHAVMVARGDLGVEVSYEKVPLLQKQIVQKCIAQAKPVIVATQMMESMITSFAPTRAEVNDVANAVLDGADAVMLSGETSVGQYPVQAVTAMRQIAEYTEVTGKMHNLPTHQPQKSSAHFLSDSICYNAAQLAEQTDAKAIVVFTNVAKPVFWISSYRKYKPIYVFTTNRRMRQILPLAWGVEVITYPEFDLTSEALAYANEYLEKATFLEQGDRVVYVGHIPFRDKRAPNMLQIGEICEVVPTSLGGEPDVS